jgi:CheY-like chemotaxis protein
MIYLIDDKKYRQSNDYGWDVERFASNYNSVTPIYDLVQLKEQSDEIRKRGNTVLYHESFLDHTSFKNKAVDQRKALEFFVTENSDFYLAIFSGSKNSRELSKNVCYLPVSVLYQNLEVFAKNHREGDHNLNYLLFGNNPNIEKKMAVKLEKALAQSSNVVGQSVSSSVFFFQPFTKVVQDPFVGVVPQKINKVEDEDFSSYISKWLEEAKFDYIFIPISIGKTLSDFNGLRLATHIRCTPGLNQLTNLIIYSFVGIDELMDNEYFDILKTKNVSLVPYDKAAFSEKASHSPASELTASELPKEVSNLNLKPPKNYQDTHSVKNEWAIYQWAHAIGATDDKEVQRIIGNVEHNVYFKYLKTTSVSNSWEILSDQELKIKSANDSKVLLIDDETNKGWHEIFCALLADRNNIDFHDFGESFKGLNTDEVVRQSVGKILDENFDLVILDFRLHSDDFSDGNLDNITSIRILKEVKKSNPGVQVVVFSATSKAWNLQAIQNAGADGFVFKDGSGDVSRSIENMISLVSDSLVRAKHLKNVYAKLTKAKQLSIELKLSEAFDRSLASNMDVVFQLLLKSFREDKYRNYAYLQLFLIIENFVKEASILVNQRGRLYVMHNKGRHEILGKKENGERKCKMTFNKNERFYEKIESIYKWKIDTNFNVSALLLFRYGCNDSNEKNWPAIRDNRNEKAAHPVKGNIQPREFIDLIDFMIFLFDKRNAVGRIDPSLQNGLKSLEHLYPGSK